MLDNYSSLPHTTNHVTAGRRYTTIYISQPCSNISCMCVCVCVCVFTSVHDTVFRYGFVTMCIRKQDFDSLSAWFQTSSFSVHRSLTTTDR